MRCNGHERNHTNKTSVHLGQKQMMKQVNQIHWARLIIAVSGVLLLSFGLAYLFQGLVTRFHFPLYHLAWLAYLIVFATSLVSNLTILAPVPFAVSIMIAAATEWNPVLIALFASIGGSLGELSGYYAGYGGRKIAISESFIKHSRVESWVRRYGIWAILFLAFQPVIPFDIGGLVAGAAKMPVHQFLLALWGGKFTKYVIITYTGVELTRFIPFLSL
jgi:membrane protein YqaA with SNARE-associated domain